MLQFHYLNPGNWRALRERSLVREWLGLREWLALPDEERSRDDNHAIQAIGKQILKGYRAPNPIVGDKSPEQELTVAAEQRLLAIDQRLYHSQPLPMLDPQQLHDWHQQRKKMRNQLVADTRLLQLPLEQIRDSIPFLTAFFFLSSYVIVAYYLGHFGIRVSRFFSLWDYVSTSMDALRGLLISFAVAGAAMLLAFRRARLRLLQQALGAHRGLALLHWFMMALGLATITALWLKENGWMISVVYGTAAYVLIFITPKFFTSLRKPVRAMFITSFLAIYSIMIVNLVTGSIAFASLPHNQFETLYAVTFADGPTEKPYRLLAGNSQWLFLQDEQLKIKVVPLQQIRNVEVIPPQASNP